MTPHSADRADSQSSPQDALIEASKDIREASRTLRLASRAARKQLSSDIFSMHQRVAAAIGRLWATTGRTVPPEVPAPHAALRNDLPFAPAGDVAVFVPAE